MSVDNLERWDRVARRKTVQTWRMRAEFAAHFIRPGDIVCDLGAGAQPLKMFLPPSVGYIPVDCVAVYPGTHIADFNTEFSLPEQDFNVIVCLGVLDHLHDKAAFLKRLSEMRAGKFIIFSCSCCPPRNPDKKAFPILHNLGDGVSLFSQYISDLSVVARVSRYYMFTGILKQGEQASEPQKLNSLNKLLFAKATIWDYFFLHSGKKDF